MDRLNFFNPFNDKNIGHEDVLTRNFLLLIKSIPAVQTAFFELIRIKSNEIIDEKLESIAIGDLKINEVYTQVTSGTEIMNINKENNLLSIIISDDEHETHHEVSTRENKARYDGVIMADPGWLFIIENKPSKENIWDNQLDPNLVDAEGNHILKNPCCISWREVISILNNVLVNSTSSEIERTLISDFFEYVNETYPWLNPYDRFGRCGKNKRLLDNRCADVLKCVFNRKEISSLKGWKRYVNNSEKDNVVQYVALDADDKNIYLWMYAGDTMSSARSFYDTVDIDSVRLLMKKGYKIEPNFHISYQGTGLVWLSSILAGPIDYLNYWKTIAQQKEIKQIKREDLNVYYNELVNKRIVDPNDALVNEKLLSKNYPVFNIAPGCLFRYVWTIEEAVALDNKGKFEEDCRKRIIDIQNAYNLTLGI